jgi:hypothetical protein
MLPVVLALAAIFSLFVWWAITASRPLSPIKIVRDDTYKPTKKEQKCFDCGGPLGVWYRVMRCDRCLVAYNARMDAGEIGKVDGAMSVAELERLWANSK